MSNPPLGNVVIYLKKPDMVITSVGTMSLEVYFKAHVKDDDEQYKKWMEIM